MINLYFTPINTKLKNHYSKLNPNELNIDKDIYSIKDYTKFPAKFLSWYKYNEHHWAPHSAIDFLRELLTCENIDIKFDDLLMHEKHKWCDIHNIDLYRPTIGEYELSMFDNSFKLIGNSKLLYNELITINKVIVHLTEYHKQFIAPHMSIKIHNKKPIMDYKVLLGTDSMSIPLIPIMAQFFSELDILEFRLPIYDIKFSDYDKIIIIQEFCNIYKLTDVFNKLLEIPENKDYVKSSL